MVLVVGMVVAIVVMVVVVARQRGGFAGWQWWLVFFSQWQLGFFKIFFMVVVSFQTQGNGEEKWVDGDGFGCVDAGG